MTGVLPQQRDGLRDRRSHALEVGLVVYCLVLTSIHGPVIPSPQTEKPARLTPGGPTCQNRDRRGALLVPWLLPHCPRETSRGFSLCSIVVPYYTTSSNLWQKCCHPDPPRPGSARPPSRQHTPMPCSMSRLCSIALGVNSAGVWPRLSSSQSRSHHLQQHLILL